VKTAKSNAPTIDEYIRGFPRDVRRTLSALRSTIRKNAPDATEKMSYGMPTFYLHENLVHFAAFERHIGFYPTPGPIVTFRDELKAYKTSKGAIQFPLDEPLPLRLIARIVKYRVAEAVAARSRKERRKV
jgi:uncharacterized protein YdhG (YjbR/CyaY superfamily)